MPLSRSVAEFNRRVTNRVSRHIVGWFPGFGLVRHAGRRSGRTYETPVNVFRSADRFVFALTYGRSDWVRNVLAAGSAELVTRRRTYVLSEPRIVASPDHADLPALVRPILKQLNVTEELHAAATRR